MKGSAPPARLMRRSLLFRPRPIAGIIAATVAADGIQIRGRISAGAGLSGAKQRFAKLLNVLLNCSTASIDWAILIATAGTVGRRASPSGGFCLETEVST